MSRPRFGSRQAVPILLSALLPLATRAAADSPADTPNLSGLSLEELSNVEVTSVSKTAEKLSDAPAAIYVITHDDIIRSGATTIPEMLRLAPNLHVAQLNAATYAISARGFNVGDNASMSDKLLVLIDGRTVYTPLFAGVYWDMQEVLPENIERIEVISGPGGTLWGANAVNGVINIITRKSADTQGGLLDLGGGNLERMGSFQYGGRLADDLTYRVHVEGAEFSPNKTSAHTDAEDGWSRPQGGFRLDWTPPGDSVTAEGDLFHVSTVGGNAAGSDMIASWDHDLGDGAAFRADAYFDEARLSGDNSLGFVIDTYNFDVQHNFPLGSWNEIVWGAGDRAINYRVA
ncbi:MAG TPA: TonB-dependent receptor plug domain-containing protein, partial [Stellaceae bacterium]|nr:TonB-dependent receptor plug domain-containing protein [Stellaceae bacterium]